MAIIWLRDYIPFDFLLSGHYYTIFIMLCGRDVQSEWVCAAFVISSGPLESHLDITSYPK